MSDDLSDLLLPDFDDDDDSPFLPDFPLELSSFLDLCQESLLNFLDWGNLRQLVSLPIRCWGVYAWAETDAIIVASIHADTKQAEPKTSRIRSRHRHRLELPRAGSPSIISWCRNRWRLWATPLRPLQMVEFCRVALHIIDCCSMSIVDYDKVGIVWRIKWCWMIR